MANKKLSRRRFVQSTLCGVVLGGGVTWQLLRSPSEAWAQTHIRPPGALKENDFLSACIRCGLCVQACPYDTLNLFELDTSTKAATPYFIARDIPCEMCVDIPCVEACPTGALDPQLKEIAKAQMGTAALTHPHFCNSYIGASYCDSCYQACPLKDEAIYLVIGQTEMGGLFTPTVDPDICTGCGKCEHACIANLAAIRVSPDYA